MSEFKHTPGPWQNRDDYTLEGQTTIIANVDGETFSDGTTSYTYDTIAVCCDEFGEYLDNAKANARLIAAAPELLEALRAAENHFGLFAEITINGQHDPDDVRVTALIRAAIAKATGGAA